MVWVVLEMCDGVPGGECAMVGRGVNRPSYSGQKDLSPNIVKMHKL